MLHFGKSLKKNMNFILLIYNLIHLFSSRTELLEKVTGKQFTCQLVTDYLTQYIVYIEIL